MHYKCMYVPFLIHIRMLLTVCIPYVVVVHLVKIKCDDLTSATVSLADWPKIAKDIFTSPSKSIIGVDFDLMIEEKFTLSPN